MEWQLQEAKQRFSQLVQRALDDGPQVVTRRGEPVVVIVAKQEFDRLRGPQQDFKDFLLSAPDFSDLTMSRSREPSREVDL